MRKLISENRRWDGTEWTVITRFIETDTGEVYQHEREYTCDLIRPEEILDTLSVGAPIDKYKYMAPMRPEWREFVGDPNDPSIFIKEPGYSGKESAAHYEREISEREIEAYHTPGFQHRNLVAFHGCVVENGHVAGLALTRLSKSLYDVAYIFWLNHHRKGGDTPPVLVTDDGIPFDHDSVMSGVRPALDHLRSLGFVYLDIKTENIMWAWDEAREGEPKTGRWCLIDFGDVYPPGKVFEHPPGTYGWNSDEGGVAEDLLEISLGYLTTYLKTGKRKFDGCPDSPAQIALAKIRDEARERRKELAKKVVAEGSKVGEVE